MEKYIEINEQCSFIEGSSVIYFNGNVEYWKNGTKQPLPHSVLPEEEKHSTSICFIFRDIPELLTS
jgi:hypothetical protein